MGNIVLSEYKYNNFKKRELTDKQIEQYKDKFVLFETDWNDYNFYSLFCLVYFDDKEDYIIGFIRIFNDDMEISEEKYDHRFTKHFILENKLNLKKFDLKNNPKFYSIGNMQLYNNLIKKFDDKTVEKILLSLREVSTINDNKIIDKNRDKPWFENSLIREKENKKLIGFTILKNENDISENSYLVLKNMLQYSDKLTGKIDKLVDWALEYDLCIDEAKMLFHIISSSKKIDENMKNLLYKFKKNYSEYTDFVKDIDDLLEINIEFYSLVSEIQSILKVEKKELNKLKIGHYTSLKTIKNLIACNNEDMKLRFTNGRQMNDPLEGKVLSEYIFGGASKEEPWVPTFWYISSATTEIDSLPMWKQYGDDATGVVLVYDSDFLNDIVELYDIEVYRVAYIDSNDNNSIKISNNNNSSDDNYEELKNKIIKLKRLVNKNKNDFLIPILSNIEFLFKKYDYSYENEYRIIINMEGNNKLDIEMMNREDSVFPFLYVYLEGLQPKYSELLLGPKSIDIDYIAPYINYCDNSIKVRKSSIAFR